MPHEQLEQLSEDLLIKIKFVSDTIAIEQIKATMLEFAAQPVEVYLDNMTCPNCDSVIPLNVEEHQIVIHEKPYSIPLLGYHCPKCEADYTTSEIDTCNLALAKFFSKQTV